MDRPALSPRLVVGLFVVVVAVLFLLENAGLVEIDRFLPWWPMILVVLGGTQLVWSHGLGPRLVGAFMVGAGALFLYANHYPDRLDWATAWGWLWPVALLLVGVVLLLSRRTGDELDDDNRLSAFLLMSGHSLKSTAPRFRGGELTLVMGGYQLDLTGARMTEDDGLIEIFALMGGLELRIPRDWTVQTEVTCLMGGIDNKASADPGASHVLRLKGCVIMGGIEIEN